MPWTDAPFGGFSPVRPWLRMASDAPTRNVARQAADPRSVLSAYRRLVWLRHDHPALQVGEYRRLPGASGDVLAWLRVIPDETVLVAVNFGRGPGWARAGGHPAPGTWEPLFGTHDGLGPVADGARFELRPLEAVVFVGRPAAAA
jgi:alpha-glucosidase